MTLRNTLWLIIFSFLWLPATARSQDVASTPQEIPTIKFCEMVRRPKLYFNKLVRVNARYQMAIEGSYISHGACPLSHDDQIGVHFAIENDQQRDAINEVVRKIGTSEYGGKADVSVVGMLRNQSRRDFVWYKYQFDVSRMENIEHVVVPYSGELQGAVTYRATVRGDKESVISLTTPVRMPLHYALFLEWSNLNEFPELTRLRESGGQKQIVFSVIADERKQMTVDRWNRSTTLKIIRIE